MRRNQLNGHKSIVIWFTDLSDFGKLTLAHSVEEDMGKTSVSDGDNVRHGLSLNLTFSNDDLKESIRRIGEAPKLMMDLNKWDSKFLFMRSIIEQML